MRGRAGACYVRGRAAELCIAAAAVAGWGAGAGAGEAGAGAAAAVAPAVVRHSLYPAGTPNGNGILA